MVINKVAHDDSQLIGGKKDSCLLIDETGFPKKGTKSVGVARQCGQIGKVDNCQVGVYAVLGNQSFQVPVDFRLYLTESWVNDEQRCIDAGIPKDQIVFQSKHDLALKMVIMARIRGLGFNWVGFDGFYGENPYFLKIKKGRPDHNQRTYLKIIESNLNDAITPFVSEMTNKG